MLKDFTVSDYAAWWGAVISTLVFIWEVFKWIHRGPLVKLDMEILGNMKMFPKPPKDETFISVRVSNTGEIPITLTKLAFVHYRWWFKYFLNLKAEKSFIVPQPISTMPIPYKLDTGSIWDGNILQNDEVNELYKTGYICILLFHSGKMKPIRQKLKIKK